LNRRSYHSDDAQTRKKGSATLFYARSIVPILSLVCLSAIAVQGFLLEALETHLAYHMIFEHAIFFLIGALSVLSAEAILRFLLLSGRENIRDLEIGATANNEISSSSSFKYEVGKIWSRVLRIIFSKIPGLLWLTIAIVLTAFWHMPAVFDLASTYPNVHMLQHISFIVVGAAGFMAARAFGSSLQIILLVLIISMMGFTGLLFTVLDEKVYIVYSVSDHNVAGNYMIIASMLVLIVGFPMYLIRKTVAYVRATYSIKE
jgi:hypothetical protein